MTFSAGIALELIVRLTLLLFVSLLASRMLQRKWPVLVATAQDLVLLGLLVLPILTFCGPTLPWRVLPAGLHARQGEDKPLPASLQSAITQGGDRRLTMSQPADGKPSPARRAVAALPPVVARPLERVTPPPGAPRNPIGAAVAGRRALPEFSVWGGVACVYAAGCLFFLARVAAGLARLRKLLHQSSPVDRGEWLRELGRWQRDLKVDRAVRLFKSAAVATPMTFNWRGAVILIPAELERTATAEQCSAAILHELVHVERFDFAWQLLLRLVEAIYWFHPLQWLFSRSMTGTRELVCDAVCARHLGSTCYAGSLIELCGRVRKLSLPAVGLAMARSSRLRQRLVNLERVGTAVRSRATHAQLAVLATMIGVLVAAAGTVAPVAAVARPAQKVTKESDAKTNGASNVSGRLVDDRGEPFREIEVKARITIWYSFASKEKPVFLERAVRTDRDGRFVLESLAAPKPDSRYEFRLQSPQFVSVNKSVTSEKIVNGALGDLNPSRLVAAGGRVLDPNGRPVAKAVVTVVAVGGKPSDDSLPETMKERVETDASGRFTANVPAYREYGLMVRSDAGAIVRIVVPEGTETLADIPLARGVTVSGRVLTKDGRPIAGCVVCLKSNDDQSLRTELTVGSQELAINDFRVTDSDGRFRFSPVLGSFLVHLVPRNEAFRADSAEFRRAVDPPPFVPVALRLDRAGERAITLIEAPTAKVSGTIRKEDGSPAAGLTVRLMIPPQGGNSYLNLGETRTDPQGHFSLQAPIPLEQLIVTTDTQFGANGQRLEVRPVDFKVFSTRSQFGMLTIRQFDGDRAGLDCVLAPVPQQPDLQAARTEEATKVSPDLLELERGIKTARDAFVKASDSAQTQEEKDLAYNLFPGQDLINRCMELESKHRGTRTAIGAMHWIMRMAAMNSDNPATAARVRLISVLRDHYMANADVDLLIDEFPHGETPLEAETLLRQIGAQSPHDYVRATALFELAEVLLSQARLYDLYHDDSNDKTVDAMIAAQPSERTRRWMRAQNDLATRIRDAYRQRGTKAMTAEAERLYDQVVTQFADVRRPERRWEGPEDIRLVDDEHEPAFRRWTLAERADTKRFQMNNLRIGQPAPILEGNDYHHKRIRLGDFAGKVVVLTVTMDTVGNREMYARCAQLLEELKGKPVVCLSVVPTDGSGGYSVRDIVREMGINWPIVRDTRGDRLAHRWCQETFPEAYVIDARGVIRFHESGRESVSAGLGNTVKELLGSPGRAD